MGSDVVRIICPNLKCKAVLSVPGSARGKTVRCRQCGARVEVPLQSNPLSLDKTASPTPPATPTSTSTTPNPGSVTTSS